MEYEVDCQGCNKELTISGAYIGTFNIDDCWCEDCGYGGWNVFAGKSVGVEE